MRGRGLLLAVLLVAACARQFTTVGKAGYAPKWRVGDWWVVKIWEPATSGLADDSNRSYRRYDVAGVEKIGRQDCYVLRAASPDRGGGSSGTDLVWYVRTDNWIVVRQVLFSGPGSDVTPDTQESPQGLVGPLFGGEQCLPRFPLKPERLDTMFKPRRLEDYSAWSREISSVAEPVSVKRLLDEGDTACGRVVRPTGVVFEVRTEAGGELGLRAQPPGRRIIQSRQLWSHNQPWRVYGELAHYDAANPVWRVVERSWLVAVGHKKR